MLGVQVDSYMNVDGEIFDIGFVFESQSQIAALDSVNYSGSHESIVPLQKGVSASVEKIEPYSQSLIGGSAIHEVGREIQVSVEGDVLFRAAFFRIVDLLQQQLFFIGMDTSIDLYAPIEMRLELPGLSQGVAARYFLVVGLFESEREGNVVHAVIRPIGAAVAIVGELRSEGDFVFSERETCKKAVVEIDLEVAADRGIGVMVMVVGVESVGCSVFDDRFEPEIFKTVEITCKGDGKGEKSAEVAIGYFFLVQMVRAHPNMAEIAVDKREADARIVVADAGRTVIFGRVLMAESDLKGGGVGLLHHLFHAGGCLQGRPSGVRGFEEIVLLLLCR